MSSQSDWVKQRLPAGSNFSKNGVTVSLDEAVDGALEDHDSESDLIQKKLALADLLDILAADVKYQEEKLGEWTGKGQVLSERATALRDEAAAGEENPGAFGFIPATFSSHSVSDEFSN